jgi:putative hydrolases of HD superfamily
MEIKAENPVNHLNGSKINPMIGLFYEFSHLKQLYRQGWLKRGVPKEKCESVADHSFGVALLSHVVAEEYFPELDSKKIVLLGLIHDLGEVYAGDLTPHDKISQIQKSKSERESIEELFLKLPNGKKYVGLWHEYETQSSKEAIFVHKIDKLEMLLQASIYENQGYGVEEFFPYVKQRISEPKLKKIVDDLFELRKNKNENIL